MLNIRATPIICPLLQEGRELWGYVVKVCYSSQPNEALLGRKQRGCRRQCCCASTTTCPAGSLALSIAVVQWSSWTGSGSILDSPCFMCKGQWCFWNGRDASETAVILSFCIFQHFKVPSSTSSNRLALYVQWSAMRLATAVTLRFTIMFPLIYCRCSLT